MGTTNQEDIFYASYGAGRSRAQFNKDCNAFFSGLAQARQSSSNPSQVTANVNQYVARVARLKR